MKTQSKKTVLALANTIEVCAGVAHEVMGGDVASTLDSERVTRQSLAAVAASRIQARFAKYTSKKAAQ